MPTKITKKDVFVSRSWGAGGMPFSVLYMNPHGPRSNHAVVSTSSKFIDICIWVWVSFLNVFIMEVYVYINSVSTTRIERDDREFDVVRGTSQFAHRFTKRPIYRTTEKTILDHPATVYIVRLGSFREIKAGSGGRARAKMTIVISSWKWGKMRREVREKARERGRERSILVIQIAKCKQNIVNLQTPLIHSNIQD